MHACRTTMFEGEKTYVFWVGLTILGLASVGLFTILWLIFMYYPAHYHFYHGDYPKYFPTYFWKYYVWFIVGAVVFILIGSYMLKSCVEREKKIPIWKI